MVRFFGLPNIILNLRKNGHTFKMIVGVPYAFKKYDFKKSESGVLISGKNSKPLQQISASAPNHKISPP